jgi:hypothetical protein
MTSHFFKSNCISPHLKKMRIVCLHWCMGILHTRTDCAMGWNQFYRSIHIFLKLHFLPCLFTELANSEVWELPTDCFDTSYKSNLQVWLFWRKSLVVFKILDLVMLLFYWVALKRFCNIKQYFFLISILCTTRNQALGSRMEDLISVYLFFYLWYSLINMRQLHIFFY